MVGYAREGCEVEGVLGVVEVCRNATYIRIGRKRKERYGRTLSRQTGWRVVGGGSVFLGTVRLLVDRGGGDHRLKTRF